MKKIEIPRWLIKLPTRQEGQSGPSGSIFWCLLALPFKSHRGILTFLIFLYSSHEADIENVFKTSSDFLLLFQCLRFSLCKATFDSNQINQSINDALLYVSMYVYCCSYPIVCTSQYYIKIHRCEFPTPCKCSEVLRGIYVRILK